MKEKREFARLDLNVKVDWKRTLVTSEPGQEFSDKTKNISAGGLCLVVYEKLDIGEILEIEMVLPSKETIRAEGKVVWISEYEIEGEEEETIYDIGVQFVKISDKEREEISKFVFASFDAKKE
jgi:c-di-GMP-binding flagellar brake protein YcgR